VEFGSRKLGVEVVLGSSIGEQMYHDTYYCWRVTVDTFDDPSNSLLPTQRYRIYQDRNEIITVDEVVTVSTLTKGTFGTKSFKALLTHKEVELYQWPLNFDFVYPELFIYPKIQTVVESGHGHPAPGSTINFTGRGGLRPYHFSFEANNSGGTIDAETGAYVSGSAGVTDHIKVTDEHGEVAIALIDVI